MALCISLCLTRDVQQLMLVCVQENSMVTWNMSTSVTDIATRSM
jgi:hypothetical protein